MPIAASSATLASMVEALERLAERRIALRPVSEAARGRAARLADHLARHLRVRARSLDAPLVVLLLGPTGAGKSTLFNTLAGRQLSPTGVLRPTTRTAIVLAAPADRAALEAGPLAGLDGGQVHLVSDDGATAPGLAVVDAPDVDSIEHANRALADRLVEAADLCIFVTTAARYADRVPWTVLDRVRERGLPLVVVVNRLPPDESDRREVLADVRRLFEEAGLYASADVPAAEAPAVEAETDGPRADDRATTRAGPGEAGSAGPGEPARLEIIGIGEGRLVPGGDALDPADVTTLSGRIAELRGDREARVRLAARALAGSLAGLGPLVDQIADDCAHEAIDAAALRRAAADNHERGLGALRDGLGRGTFLREEALRHWQEYVGADDVTRFFSKGIGAVRGMIAGLFRPSTAPVAEVRDATTDDLLSLARQHAAEAARRTATAWADEPAVAGAVAADASLWAASDGFDERFRARLDAWIASIATDIAETGEGKRRLAKGASIGINALGTGVMLATFIHTAGLTGTEVGIAAGTAFLNQKLLGALFGEAAMVELIARARQRLHAALTAAFDEERERFDRLVTLPDELEALERDLRAAADEVRSLPEGLSAAVEPVVGAAVGSAVDPTGPTAAG